MKKAWIFWALLFVFVPLIAIFGVYYGSLWHNTAELFRVDVLPSATAARFYDVTGTVLRVNSAQDRWIRRFYLGDYFCTDENGAEYYKRRGHDDLHRLIRIDSEGVSLSQIDDDYQYMVNKGAETYDVWLADLYGCYSAEDIQSILIEEASVISKSIVDIGYGQEKITDRDIITKFYQMIAQETLLHEKEEREAFFGSLPEEERTEYYSEQFTIEVYPYLLRQIRVNLQNGNCICWNVYDADRQTLRRYGGRSAVIQLSEADNAWLMALCGIEK